MVVEASERKQLAALTIRAIASVDNLTHGLSLLPVKNDAELTPSRVDAASAAEDHASSGRKGAKC